MTMNERISLPIWKKIILFIIYVVVFSLQLLLFFSAIYVTFMGYNNASYVIYTYIGTEVLGFVFVLIIIHSKSAINFKLTWCILVSGFPLPFCILYLMNVTSTTMSKKKRDKMLKALHINSNVETVDLGDDNTARALVNTIKSDTKALLYKTCEFTFFSDIPQKHKDMLAEMEKATDYIYLEYFTISKGVLMDSIYDVLKRKGEEGVTIRILYDEIGSKKFLTPKLIKNLSSIPNCKVCNFSPLGLNWNLLLNYRDHRKIAIIDGRVAYCGGDNLADEYIHEKNRFGYWRDNCAKYRGKVVEAFISLFAQMWYISTKEKLTKLTLREDNIKPNSYCIPFGDGPFLTNHPGYDLFCAMISSAKKSIIISTPYFIIDDSLLQLIKLKAKEKVDVKILMPSHPDKYSPFFMGRERYGILIEAGVKIYELNGGFNHAKNLIIDNEYAFIGTINFDYRSFYLHYECGALVFGCAKIKDMTKDYNEAIKNATLITYEKWKKRNIFQKIIAYILNIFAPLF